jgi:hypothetical protein
MYKEYEDRERAGQSGNWRHLVYESSYEQTLSVMNGRWFYFGYENSNLYSGRWYLNDLAYQ